MVSRRGLLGGALAGAAAMLSGCGRGRAQLVETIEEATASAPGVTEVALEMDGGANFETLLRGTVSLEGEDRAGGIAVFDEAMRAIITVVHEELDKPEAESLRVGWITGVLASGEEITPMDLGPEILAANPRRDRITARAFYSKYGLS